jgi:hypothetical protein
MAPADRKIVFRPIRSAPESQSRRPEAGLHDPGLDAGMANVGCGLFERAAVLETGVEFMIFEIR